MKRRFENLLFWISKRLPQRLRYYVLVTCIADATTGRYGNTDPHTLNVIDLMERTPGSLA